MAMHSPKLKTVLAVLLPVLLLCCVVGTLAWFSNTGTLGKDFSGSVVLNYFGGGNGTAERPFIINKPRHLYNLAWLQNLGKVPDNTYFELQDDINMSGLGAAVPPIGCDAYPFYGKFDGQGYTISNLWVSSNPTDWNNQHPTTAMTAAAWGNVGFFGKLDEKADKTAIAEAKDFVLKNLEVTTASGSTLGLAAGYSGGRLSHIGIDNGKLNIAGTTASSQTVLVGQLAGGVSWVDQPGVQGGHVLIDPTGDNFAAIAANSYDDVHGSTNDSAFYVGALGRSTVDGGIKGRSKYSNKIELRLVGSNLAPYVGNSPLTNNTATASNATTVNATAGNVDSNAWNRITTNTPTPLIISPTVAPNFSSLQAVPRESGTDGLPQNGIWFKPSEKGTCTMVITQTNKSDNPRLSLYYYRRTESGAVDMTTRGETILESSLGNKYAVVFEIEIPQEAIDGEWEFVVGKSSLGSSTVAGFAYLILAGAGNVGSEGDTSKPIMEHVDYTYERADGSYDVFDEEYTQKNVLLTFSNLTNAEAPNGLCFKADANGVYFNNGNVTDSLNPSKTATGFGFPPWE